jgi:hypothetical protein
VTARARARFSHRLVRGGTVRRTVLLLVLLAGGCVPTAPSLVTDSSQKLNADRRYAHSAQGDVIFGPSRIDELVVGQPDAAGNVHVAK